jgi:hypothetical protein
VLTACLAFVVQAGIVIALVRLIRKMQGKTAGFMEKSESLLAKVEPVLDKVGPVSEKIELALDSISDAAAKFGPAIDRFCPVFDKAVVVVERTGMLIQNVNQVRPVQYLNNIVEQDHRAIKRRVRLRGDAVPYRALLCLLFQSCNTAVPAGSASMSPTTGLSRAGLPDRPSAEESRSHTPFGSGDGVRFPGVIHQCRNNE